MNLDFFAETPPYALTKRQDLFRIQAARARSGNPAIDALRVAPAGMAGNRFDCTDVRVAYSPTRLRQQAMRRSGGGNSAIPLERRRREELLCAHISDELSLLDLTPHAAALPVLQSLRFSATQALAMQAWAAGFDGLAYLSAQRHGGICFALFVRARWRERLVDPRSGNLHWLVATVAKGARLPLM